MSIYIYMQNIQVWLCCHWYRRYFGPIAARSSTRGRWSRHLSVMVQSMYKWVCIYIYIFIYVYMCWVFSTYRQKMLCCHWYPHSFSPWRRTRRGPWPWHLSVMVQSMYKLVCIHVYIYICMLNSYNKWQKTIAVLPLVPHRQPPVQQKGSVVPAPVGNA